MSYILYTIKQFIPLKYPSYPSLLGNQKAGEDLSYQVSGDRFRTIFSKSLQALWRNYYTPHSSRFITLQGQESSYPCLLRHVFLQTSPQCKVACSSYPSPHTKSFYRRVLQCANEGSGSGSLVEYLPCMYEA